MEHIFHKIILNIYFDHIHVICLYRIFSVLGLYASFVIITMDKFLIWKSLVPQIYFAFFFLYRYIQNF